MKVVNLSRRRFVNVRPVTRTTAALWVLGAGLLATNLFLFLQYWIDSVEVRSQRQQTLDLIDQQRDAIRDLNLRFDRLDLPVQNDKVEFLNTLINARTFPWSQLFDDLEEVLIPDARVISVQPAVVVEKEQPRRRQPVLKRSTQSRRSRQKAAEKTVSEEAPPAETVHRKVRLSLRGYVKDDQALADLVDAFYADPSFERPYLAGESTDASVGGLSFTLDVTYLLSVQPPAGVRLPDESVAAGPPDAGSPAAEAVPEAASVGAAEGSATPESDQPAERADAESPEESVREGLRPSPGEEAAAADAGTRGPRQRPPGPPSRLVADPPAESTGVDSTDAGSPPPRVSTAPRLRPADAPPAPASPEPRPVAPDSPRSPHPPPVRPRYVGPAATGTPRLSGGGGAPS